MSTPPKLVADIGGTNARFALYYPEQQTLAQAHTLATTDFATIDAAIQAYLSIINKDILDAAIAIANPVIADTIQMTNHHWHFSIKALQQSFGFSTLKVINDFVAQALAIFTLNEREKLTIASGFADKTTPIAVIGPGTGLGVSILTPFNGQQNQQWQALATEGGHVSFAPRNECEVAIWRYAQKIYGEHISAERFLCGSGLTLIDNALAHIHGKQQPSRSPQSITQALMNNDESARETIDVFCAMLATVSADLILTSGARGGLYLCGGILPRIANYFIEQSSFYTRLVDKGRFRQYLTDIPVSLVIAQDSGLRGAAVALAQNEVNS